jgi:hypothetical protein
MVRRPSIQGEVAGALFGFGDGAGLLALWSMLELVSLRWWAPSKLQLSPLRVCGFALVDEDFDDQVVCLVFPVCLCALLSCKLICRFGRY